MKRKTSKSKKKNDLKIISGILSFYILAFTIFHILTWPVKTVFIADFMVGIAMAIGWVTLFIYFGFSITQCLKVIITDSKKRNL